MIALEKLSRIFKEATTPAPLEPLTRKPPCITEKAQPATLPRVATPIKPWHMTSRIPLQQTITKKIPAPKHSNQPHLIPLDKSEVSKHFIVSLIQAENININYGLDIFKTSHLQEILISEGI